MINKRIISYYGGKARLADRLIEWMPDHDNYFEAFAGGLSVFFKKKKAKWSAVNDLDSDISNLYYVCSRKDLFKEFKELAFYLVQSKDIYDIIRENIKEGKGKFEIPNVQRAVDYFFYISTSFNNRPGTSLSKNANKWGNDLLEKVAYSRKKMEDVYISNMDVNDFIDKYIGTEKAFWFFDPPYYVANDTEYYSHVFRRYHHERFSKSIKKLATKSNANIMITYDDHPKVRELFDGFYIKEVGVKYSSTYETVDTNEIVITNYELYDNQQSLF